MSGKLAGQLYKVYISPSGTKYYSLSKAVKDGKFQSDGHTDGRKGPRKLRKK